MVSSLPKKPAVKKLTKNLVGKWLKIGWSDAEPSTGICVYKSTNAMPLGLLIIDGIHTRVLGVNSADQIIKVGPEVNLEIPQELL